MTNILILGAGYTGIAAAIRTATRTRRHGGKVTLVSASPRFTERLRLHQTAAGERLRDHAIADIIAGTGIDLVLGRVTALDPVRHEVIVNGVRADGGPADTDRADSGPLGTGRADGGRTGRVLAYDKLIYALGTVTDLSTPGVAEHAYVYDDHDQAVRLARRLGELDRGTVVVAGGGLTGVESATELAEAHPNLRVVLLSRGRPGSMMGEQARAYVDKAMTRLGIQVRGGADVVKVLPDAVELAGGDLVDSDATLWTAGTRGLPLAAEAGLAVDGQGRIVVDSALRSVSHPDVYAVGDAAAVRQPYGVMHGTCQGGIPTGLHAADALADGLLGRPVKAFRFGYVHQPLSLGRKDAVIQFTHPDDTPRRWYLTGRWAIAYKETVSSSPMPTYRLLKRGLVPVGLFRLTAGVK
ncbi:NAD(P)/FAD-dependent oxidoreductase [Nonomuraea sp. NEAU-A123]|uniref:NAD(P)/FAD-dependent oxidoreductase n=1 Tax=Nonomuraea sp. NEAU-A123 TaxID=2839649 RepID=UPI001BE420A4|nr:FAD-dependent oxidoreductase [Nonomuraea sp. NEAU-A123]MBT2228614.1 FAD-dependent oxidoreductase [Nonomuraea sp. NEAU-A123]